MTITIDLGAKEGAAAMRLAWPPLSDEELLALCRRNRELRIERTAEGEILFMAPAGGETGNRNLKIGRQLDAWAEQDGSGLAFDSSTGFRLPNGALRSPDAAWIRRSRWETLTDEQREAFPPLCPDFVVELLSPSDRLSDALAKMDEYIANGAALGWMIDRRNRQVYVYRPNQPVEVRNDPTDVSGDPVLPGFVLDLRKIF